MKLPLFIANWKMHQTTHDVEAFFYTFARRKECWRGADVMILPSFTLLPAVAYKLRKKPIRLGAQNFYYEEGAFTGEVSARQLLDVGAKYVLIGHSERRHVFGETDAMVQKKMKAALKAGLKPILAVGETAEDRHAKKTLSVIRTQLSSALKRYPKEAYKELIVAYEPVWAIGTGIIPKPEEIEEVHAFIRTRVGRNPRIVYGGSMSPANVRDIMRQKSVQGGLVGGASLDAGKFADLIREGTKIYHARTRKS